jgi:ABC-type bacteriocin/lantibiotic exporter with double-glycine peptidase domain
MFVSRIQTRLAHELLGETIAAPYPWFLERNAAQLVRLFHNDISAWGRDCIGNMLRVLTHGLTILAGAIVVLATAPVGGVIALAIVAVLAYGILWLIRPPLIKWTNTKRQAADQTMIMETQILSGVKDIKVNGGEGYFLQLFKDAYGLMSHASARGVILGQLPTSLLLLVGQSSLLLMVLILWKSGGRGGEIASQMALIVLVTSRVVPAVTRLSATVTSLLNAIPWVEGILILRHSILESSRTATSVGGTTPVPLGWRDISFASVSFSYTGTDRMVLEDLSITLERGRSYGLIGASGAGKSTFVDLLLGLQPPLSGDILIDGQSLRTLDIRTWQRQIGYVSQAPYFTDDTIMANVAFGVSGAMIDEDQVNECLRMAGLQDFIAGLANRVHTRLGDRAVKISGGERQRIAIARALYRRPDILLLDEATGALDSTTEQVIIRSLEELRGRITMVIISHRMSAVSICDQVLLLDDGHLKMHGSYADVLRRHPASA